MQKYAKGPWTAAHAAHMKMRQEQNKKQCLSSKAESWAMTHLEATGYKWTRQAIWGWRVFDFWNHQLGIAIEIDGKEHNADYDLKRDARNWKVSRIRIIRVKNFDEEGMQIALKAIEESETWNERRDKAGLSLIKT